MAIAAVLFLIQKWHVVSEFIHPTPDYSKGHSERVILYATSWCGYCAKTRKFLVQHNVPYYEYDIEKSEEGKEQYLSLGQSGVPVLLIDGKMIHGYNPQKMAKLLDL